MTARCALHGHQRQHLTPLAACLGLILGCGPNTASASALPRTVSSTIASVTGGVNIVVANCNDSGPGSLREAVNIAASGDQIRLEDLTCSTISLSSGAITISQYELGIFGPGMDALTVDGGATRGLTQRVLDHTGTGLLTVSGFSVANGSHVAELPLAKGGCILSRGSVALYDSKVSGCHLTAMDGPQGAALGGGLGIDGSLLVKYSRIDDNVVSAHGGFARGGGAAVGGVVKSKYSTIRGNVANTGTGSASGGGLFIGSGSTGASSIYASTIEGNFAEVIAGIEFRGSTGATALISNSTISDNVASGLVGGVYSSVPLSINNSTIAFNRADTSALRGTLHAVGVAVRGHPMDLQSTIVANNEFVSGQTLDISVHTGASITGTDNLITNTYAAVPADTIIADPLLAALAYNASPRSTRTHDLLGGSPAINAGNNTASLDDDQRGLPRLAGVRVDIGAVEHHGSNRFIVTNCEDSGPGSLRNAVTSAASGDTINVSELGCSPITVTTGAIVALQEDLTIVGGGGPNRSTGGYGSVTRIHRSGVFDRVFRHDGTGTLQLWSLLIENGQYNGVAQPQGGCIRSEGEVRLWNTTVTSCVVQQGVGATYASIGGGIFAESLIARNSTITRNRAFAGDVLAQGGGAFVLRRFEIINSTIADNEAASGLASSGSPASAGGGLFAAGIGSCYGSARDRVSPPPDGLSAAGIGPGPCAVMHSTIAGNSAGAGGGLFVYAGVGEVITVSNSTISGNTAEKVGGLVAYGQLTVQHCTVAFNRSYYDGEPSGSVAAGMHLTDYAVLQSSIIANNTIRVSRTQSLLSDISVADGGSIQGANNLARSSWSLLPADTLFADPMLAPLISNGGPTLTHALMPNSPAIDAGGTVIIENLDQRGQPRPAQAAVDIGAFERQGPHDSETIFTDGYDPLNDPCSDGCG